MVNFKFILRLQSIIQYSTLMLQPRINATLDHYPRSDFKFELIPGLRLQPKSTTNFMLQPKITRTLKHYFSPKLTFDFILTLRLSFGLTVHSRLLPLQSDINHS